MVTYLDVDTAMSEEEEETYVSIFRSIMRSNHQLLKLGSEVAADFDLHLAEMNIIDMLGKYGPLTMGELSKVTFISPSNTTHTVKKLESNNRVRRQRSKDSEREVSVYLTSKGESLFKKTYPTMLHKTKLVMDDNLSAVDRKKLKELLHRLTP